MANNNIKQHITYLKVLPFTRFSDHCPLKFQIELHKRFLLESIAYRFDKFPLRFKWSHDSANLYYEALESDDLKCRLSNIVELLCDENQSYCALENTQMCSDFTDILVTAANRSLQKTKLLKNPPRHKWFNYDCLKRKRSLNKAARRVSKNPTNDTLRSDYYTAKRHYKVCLAKSKTAYIKKLNEDVENGKILNWKNFKSLKQNYEDCQSLDKHDLRNFFEYFQDLYKPHPIINNLSPSTTDIGAMSQDTHEILNEPISIEETENTLKGLKLGKSVAEDLISNEMLRTTNSLVLKAMTSLFNHCLLSGRYPWHTSVITPIHKSGDLYDPDNYRAITVGSCLGKTFSTILLNRLILFKDTYCKDPSSQLGFSKGAQTNDHILTLKTIIDKYRKIHRKKLFACFVDFKKAFDTIPRDLLLHKLVSLKIQGCFFSVINDMYENSTAKIKINNLLSASFDIRKGTEQGHPISPDLFKLYIRDLSTSFYIDGDFPILLDTIVNHLFWADDLVLLSLDDESLQKNLDILHKYCKIWGLTVNMKKTKIIQFGTRKLDAYNFVLGTDKIDIVKKYCYLGIWIHECGSFNYATNELRKKSLRALFGLKRVVAKSFLSFSALVILFDSLIKPILLYGCQVLCPHSRTVRKLVTNPESDCVELFTNDQYEGFHLKFMKWSLGVHRKSSNIGTWGESGRLPIAIDAIKLSIDYFGRVKELSNDSLVYKAFCEQRDLELDWYKSNNTLINNFSEGTSQRQSINIYKNIRERFIAAWTLAKQTSPKLNFYTSIKSEFNRESYLKITNYDHRRAITRLRISAHDLEIEQGRYKKDNLSMPIPRHKRICLYCKYVLKFDEVEDENHAMLNCPLYIKPRLKFSSKTSITMLDILKNSDNIIDMSLLGKTFHDMFEIRKSFIEYLKDKSININNHYS